MGAAAGSKNVMTWLICPACDAVAVPLRTSWPSTTLTVSVPIWAEAGFEAEKTVPVSDSRQVLLSRAES
jgi:hypothetical protein